MDKFVPLPPPACIASTVGSMAGTTYVDLSAKVGVDRTDNIQDECEQPVWIPQRKPTGYERAPIVANDDLDTTKDVRREYRDEWY